MDSGSTSHLSELERELKAQKDEEDARRLARMFVRAPEEGPPMNRKQRRAKEKKDRVRLRAAKRSRSTLTDDKISLLEAVRALLALPEEQREGSPEARRFETLRDRVDSSASPP